MFLNISNFLMAKKKERISINVVIRTFINLFIIPHTALTMLAILLPQGKKKLN